MQDYIIQGKRNKTDAWQKNKNNTEMRATFNRETSEKLQ